MRKRKLILLFASFIFLFSWFIIQRMKLPDFVVKSGIERTDQSDKYIPFSNTTVKAIGPSSLQILPKSIWERLTTPAEMLLFDPFYCLFFIGISIILFIGSKNVNYEKPFDSRALKTLYLLIGFTSLFFALNLWRYTLFASQIRASTNNAYSFNKQMFELPEFWILLILFRLPYFFKHGIILQQKVELATGSINKKQAIAKEVKELINR